MPGKLSLSWKSMKADLVKLRDSVLQKKHKLLKTQVEKLDKATDEAVDTLNKEGKVKEAEELSKEAENVKKDPSKTDKFNKKLKSLKLPKKIEDKLIKLSSKIKTDFSSFKSAFADRANNIKKKREEHKRESVEKTCELYENILNTVNNSEMLFFGKGENGNPAVNAYSIIEKTLNNHLNNNSNFVKYALENKKSSIYLFYKNLARSLNDVRKEIDKRFNKVKNSEDISEKLVKIQLYGIKIFLITLDLEKFLKKHLLKTSSLWGAVNDQRYKNAYAGIRKKCEQLSANCERVYVNMFPSKNSRVDMNDSQSKEFL